MIRYGPEKRSVFLHFPVWIVYSTPTLCPIVHSFIFFFVWGHGNYSDPSQQSQAREGPSWDSSSRTHIQFVPVDAVYDTGQPGVWGPGGVELLCRYCPNT